MIRPHRRYPEEELPGSMQEEIENYLQMLVSNFADDLTPSEVLDLWDYDKGTPDHDAVIRAFETILQEAKNA